MADEGFKHMLNANLSADIEGYGVLMDDDEEATVKTLKSFHSEVFECIRPP